MERFKYSKYDWSEFQEGIPKEVTFTNFGDMRRMQCACIMTARRKGEKWHINKTGEFTLRFLKVGLKEKQQPE